MKSSMIEAKVSSFNEGALESLGIEAFLGVESLPELSSSSERELASGSSMVVPYQGPQC